MTLNRPLFTRVDTAYRERPWAPWCAKSVHCSFLDTFAALRKATISFVMSVRPHWTTRLPLDGFHEVWYLMIFRKYVEKIQVSLKSEKNNVYFTWRPIHILYRISLISSYNEMFQTKAVEKIKTHILCSLTFLFFENRAVYEIVWKNIVKRGRPTIIIWRTRIACRISKANTHAHTHTQVV